MNIISSTIVKRFSNGVQNDYIDTDNANFVNFSKVYGGEYEKVNMTRRIYIGRSNNWDDALHFKIDRSKEKYDFGTWKWELGEEPPIIHLKNFVLEIHNPNNYKLNQIVNGITISTPSERIGCIHGSVDFEMTINTISKLLGINKPVQYNNGKILVPLFLTDYIPYTLHSYHDLYISVSLVTPPSPRIDNTNTNLMVEIDIYCEKFYNEDDSKMNTFKALYFPIEFTGTDILRKGIHTHNVKLNFNHPTYLLLIVGLNLKLVSNILLRINDTIIFDKTPVIQTNPNEPYILYFNNNFLQDLRTNINFSRIDNSVIVIKGVFEKDTNIDIISLRFNTMNYEQRMYYPQY